MVQIDGEPWFVAQDACKALNLAVDKKSGNVLFSPKRFTTINKDEVRLHLVQVNLKDDEVTTDLSSGVRGMQPKLASESGLYTLIMRRYSDGIGW